MNRKELSTRIDNFLLRYALKEGEEYIHPEAYYLEATSTMLKDPDVSNSDIPVPTIEFNSEHFKEGAEDEYNIIINKLKLLENKLCPNCHSYYPLEFKNCPFC